MSLHMAAVWFFFCCCRIIFHCVNVPQFIQSNVDEDMNTLQVLAITQVLL